MFEAIDARAPKALAMIVVGTLTVAFGTTARAVPLEPNVDALGWNREDGLCDVRWVVNSKEITKKFGGAHA